MEKKKVLESQERLDKTLSSPILSSEDSIRSLVEEQLLRSPFAGTEEEFGHVVQKRAAELSNFLGMLRSASGDKESSKSHGSLHNDWKLKQQTDQMRVMYREGPQGSPFHTLLCEGYVDGPLDCCLCVSWESTLYKKWWPQYNIPTFKIIFSSSLQKVRTGEEISIVRVKVPWPVSDREAVLHNFELEYFEEDLLLVLLNTIPDTRNIDISTHGFGKDGIPEAKDTVRIDVVGGFALQKVGLNRSYFRAIANMDIKLDFVPPWLINFISRQLIGNGHKLYQKAVVAVAAGDKDYEEALNGSMYVRIREGLYSSKHAIVGEDVKEESKHAIVGEDVKEESISSQATEEIIVEKDTSNEGFISNQVIEEIIVENVQVDTVVTRRTSTREIEEDQKEQSENLSSSVERRTSSDLSTDSIGEQPLHFSEDGSSISPEVKQALGILDNAIEMVRNLRSANGSVEPLEVGMGPETSDIEKELTSSSETYSTGNVRVDINDIGGSLVMEDFRDGEQKTGGKDHEERLVNNSSSTMCDAGSEKMESPAKNEQENSGAAIMQPSALDRMSKVFDDVTARTNGMRCGSYGNGIAELKQKKKNKKKHKYCCLSFM